MAPRVLPCEVSVARVKQLSEAFFMDLCRREQESKNRVSFPNVSLSLL